MGFKKMMNKILYLVMLVTGFCHWSLAQVTSHDLKMPLTLTELSVHSMNSSSVKNLQCKKSAVFRLFNEITIDPGPVLD